MPVEVIVLALGTLLGIGGIILAGQRMQYRHKERLVSQTDPDAVKQLREVVRDLQEEVRSLQDSSSDFDARLEFTERLLSKPRSAEPNAD
jgi:chaperonin cofactor prefoldin